MTNNKTSLKDLRRRDFLRLAKLAAGGAVVTQLGGWPGMSLSAFAIDPIQRIETPVLKLSLAAYSLRDFFSDDEQANHGKKIDLSGFVDYCASLGLEGAELTQYYFDKEVTRADILAVKRHAHLAGVDVSGGAIRNNFTVEPGPELDAQFEHVKKWIGFYADLGAPVIRVFAGKPQKGVDTDVAIERATAALAKCCEFAAERGVILGIENHDFTVDVDRLLKIVKAVESPWVGINLDTGNLNFSEDPYADMARMAPYAVNAQVKVKIKKKGAVVDTDLERVVQILRDAKYSGYVVLEYEEEDPYEHIPRYVKQLRSLVSN